MNQQPRIIATTREPSAGPDGQRTLGDAIRQRRQVLGLTQIELARRIIALGDATYRQSDVSRLERGKVTLPRRERCQCIAAALELSVGELLALSGWAGAAAVFAVEHEPSRQQDAAAMRLRAKTLARRSDLDELRSRVREAQAQTAQLLRRCETTRALYEEARLTFRFALPHRPAGSVGDRDLPARPERQPPQRHEGPGPL